MLFQDEFSLSNTATLSAAWAEKGKQPIIECKQVKKERVTGFGSANPLTGQPVASFAETGNAKTFKKHLQKVLRQYLDKQKIVIYADNVKFHRANILKLFLEVHKKNGNKAFTRIFARPESRGKGVAAYAEKHYAQPLFIISQRTHCQILALIICLFTTKSVITQFMCN